MIDDDFIEAVVIKNPKILVFRNMESDLHKRDNKEVQSVRRYLEDDEATLVHWLKTKEFKYNICYDYGKSRSSGASNTFINLMNETSFRESLQECDSLIVFVLGIAGDTNMVCFKDTTMSLDELIDPFRANNCKSLIGKPKIFVIHVYNGIEQDTKTQSGVGKKVPTDVDIFISYTKMEHDYHGTTVTRVLTDTVGLEGKEINDIFMDINEKVIVTGKCRSLYASTMTKSVYLLGHPKENRQASRQPSVDS